MTPWRLSFLDEGLEALLEDFTPEWLRLLNLTGFWVMKMLFPESLADPLSPRDGV